MRPPPLLISAACVLAACAPPPLPAAPRAPAPAVLRVATWNVHDLFDAVDRLLPPGDLDEVPSAPEVEARLDRIGAVLARLDADVVLLQEVENLPLAEALAARAGYAEARLVDGFDPRGIDVAVLSRLPISRYASHLGEVASDGRPLWSRDCTETHAGAGGARLVLVGSHLVSRLTDPAGGRRGEQAARMRQIADEAARADPGALVVAGGDLNDDPLAEALLPLLGDGGWIDVLAPVGQGGAWTWIGRTGGARFDYLLVPSADAWRVVAAEVDAGEDVAAASDHRPVVVDLHWGR